MIRLFINQPLGQETTPSLDREQCHYLKHVMRQKVTDQLLVFNGKDGEWKAEITSIEKKHGDITCLTQTKQQTGEPDIWLIFAPIKHGRIDFLVQKATELGVSTLQPIFTQNTNVSRVNIERLQANTIEAAEQCERLTIPEVRPAQKLQDLLISWPTDRQLIMCDESGKGTPIRDALLYTTPSQGGSGQDKSLKETMSSRGGLVLQSQLVDSAKHKDTPSLTLPTQGGGNEEPVTQPKYALLVGPEGGFSKDELAQLHKLPYVTSVSMGPRVMRADTAAVAALTCWQMMLGDWDQRPSFESEEKP